VVEIDHDDRGALAGPLTAAEATLLVELARSVVHGRILLSSRLSALERDGMQWYAVSEQRRVHAAWVDSRGSSHWSPAPDRAAVARPRLATGPRARWWRRPISRATPPARPRRPSRPPAGAPPRCRWTSPTRRASRPASRASSPSTAASTWSST